MRVLLFVILLALALIVPAPVTIALAVLYAFWRPAYELIGLGIVLDVQSVPIEVPEGLLFTLTFGGIVLVAEALKPHLRYYERKS